MAVTILREFKVLMRDGESFTIYSTRDLSTLDSTLHYCVSIKATGCAGLGSDGNHTYDGKTLPEHSEGHRRVTGHRVTKHSDLAETVRILESVKRRKLYQLR
jgi:hypothetical protein